MSSIPTALQNLVRSLFELIFSVFQGVFDTVSGILHAVINFAVGTLRMALHTVGDAFEAAGGLGKWVASNIVVIALIAGAIFGYLKYQGRQNRPVSVGNKKLN